MFTKQQLTFLINAQYGEDWSTRYFVESIFNLPYDSEEISDTEYEELFAILKNYSFGQVENLQIALMYLADI